jgi:type III pantothenate kinase
MSETTLLVIDIGNTNTVFGLYKGKTLVNHWRLTTRPEGTVDEYGSTLRNLVALAGQDYKTIDGSVISSVVPPLTGAMEQMCKLYFQHAPLIVGPGIKTGISILYDNPKEVGADRIVNAVAASERYGGDLIVVDFGTATTFDCVSAAGEYLGGVICPGMMISVEALFKSASKLPRVELVKPRSVIGKNTVQSMQAGIIFGYVGLVDGIVRRLKKEYKTPPKVIATGGLSTLIASETESVDHVDEYLTLDGLRILFERNHR